MDVDIEKAIQGGNQASPIKMEDGCAASNTVLPNVTFKVDEFKCLDIDNVGQWVINFHRPNLIQKEIPNRDSLRSPMTRKTTNLEPERCNFIINLAELQRMHLRKLQCKLVSHTVKMRFSPIEPGEWEADLKEYGKS
jgi:hypothetical protein